MIALAARHDAILERRLCAPFGAPRLCAPFVSGVVPIVDAAGPCAGAARGVDAAHVLRSGWVSTPAAWVQAQRRPAGNAAADVGPESMPGAIEAIVSPMPRAGGPEWIRVHSRRLHLLPPWFSG